jgi:hypothetical protein
MTQGLWPQPQQTANPALGSDLSCVSALTPQMAEVSGRRCLAENLCRRLLCDRGDLIDDLNYGCGLVGIVGSDISPADLPQIQQTIQSEFQKDSRVVSCTVSVQFVGVDQVAAAQAGTVTNPNPFPQGVLVITANIVDGQGPFPLVVSVSSLTVQLLQVGTTT